MKSQKTHVLIIGNGPSAITLSYLLSGHWPYYDSSRPHPDPDLHQRLMKETSAGRKSLMECDLEVLCRGLEGRSLNPVSVLFDALQNPEADFGVERDSCLKWTLHPDRRVDHVVVGQGAVGGSWSKMKDFDETFTVSFAQWMQLPDLAIEGHQSGTSSSGRRLSLGKVAKYYEQYVADKGMTTLFRNHSLVTGLQFNASRKNWKVTGWQEGQGQFEYIAEHVVLATGNSDSPNRLNIENEELPFVLHSLTDLDRILSDARNFNLKEPVIIVGSGLTAADAILACSQHKVPVRHVFRRHPEDPALIFNQLPENLYPEYHMVHAGMKGRTCGFDYKPFPMHSVAEIRKSKDIVVSNLLRAEDDDTTQSSTTTIRCSYLLILIGRQPDLSFIRSKKIRDQLPHFPGEALNPRSNPIRIQPFTHACCSQQRLYAMGPLVGDNFVRFVQGAALAIAAGICSSDKRTKRRCIT
jgi:hypothetical protein